MVDIRVTACQASRLPVTILMRSWPKLLTARHNIRPERLHTKKDAWQSTKHTAAGIPTWSPTVVLICRSTAYVWQSGRDAQFSADCGRMYKKCFIMAILCLQCDLPANRGRRTIQVTPAVTSNIRSSHCGIGKIFMASLQ
jgi:hypothetical protein